MSLRLFATAGLLLCAGAVHGSEPAGPFTLKKGDRIVLLGGGLIEQERLYGHLEARLSGHHPDAGLIFRNLGWGGDTVRGAARTGGFEQPDGLARLLKETEALKPTVLILGYGMNESFAGPQGLQAFVEDYGRLLDRLAPLKARTVLLSPTCHEYFGRPWPDPEEHNKHLEQYTAAIKKLAGKRGPAFVDLFHRHKVLGVFSPDPAHRYTTNGIHLNAAGYAYVAREVEEQLGLGAPYTRIDIDFATGKLLRHSGVRVDQLKSGNGALRFRAETVHVLAASEYPIPGDRLFLRVTGLGPGEYVLKVDGQEVDRLTAGEGQEGVNLTTGPAFAGWQKLREAFVRNNELFYRRWRPFNDHSRHWGFIRGDFQLYDREIAEHERAIARELASADWRVHTYELSVKGPTK